MDPQDLVKPKHSTEKLCDQIRRDLILPVEFGLTEEAIA